MEAYFKAESPEAPKRHPASGIRPLAGIGTWTRRLGLIALLLVVVAASLAEPASREQTLDHLFVRLAQAGDEQSGRRIEHLIWETWMTTGDETIDAMMASAVRALREQDFDEAIRILDAVIEAAPDYAEAWNQRATVHFLRGNYEQSLQDIAATLEREPRHFGALAGRALIRLHEGNTALAVQNIRAAMAIHPWLRERKLLPALGGTAPPVY